MAKQQACMWLARDEGEDEGGGMYALFSYEPSKDDIGMWYFRGEPEYGNADEGTVIQPAQSPVALEPGQGPVRVRLVAE